MKVVIAGSRNFTNYEKFSTEILSKFNVLEFSCIISGGARGADTLAQRFANEFTIPFTVFLPDWSQGKIGGILRNREMAKHGDFLIAFWDKKSKGTQNMIHEMKKLKKPMVIITI